VTGLAASVVTSSSTHWLLLRMLLLLLYPCSPAARQPAKKSGAYLVELVRLTDGEDRALSFDSVDD